MSVGQVQSVGVVLAGPPDHFGSYLVDSSARATSRVAARHIDFARELSFHLLQPLLVFFDVSVLATCDGTAEEAGWREFLGRLRPHLFADRLHTHVESFGSGECAGAGFGRQCSDFQAATPYGCACLPLQERTLFTQSANKYVQWGKLARAAAALVRLEARRGARFDYILKARNDLIFRPDQLLEPTWLSMLTPSDVAVPAHPFQAQRAGYFDADRREWQAAWPFNGINDQLAFGRREPMLQYLALGSPEAAAHARAHAGCWPVLDSLPRGLRSPERLLSITLSACHNLSFQLVELMYVTSHFSTRRNGSAFDMRSEQKRLAELAGGKGRCPFCLHAQRQLGRERTLDARPETALTLSRDGVHVAWAGGSSDGGHGGAWSCRAPPTLRFACTHLRPDGSHDPGRGGTPPSCCRFEEGQPSVSSLWRSRRGKSDG